MREYLDDELRRLCDELGVGDAELDAIRAKFVEFDEDRSGAINQRELSKLLASMGQEYSEVEVGLLLKQIDVDGGGVIEFVEFVRWWAGGHDVPAAEPPPAPPRNRRPRPPRESPPAPAAEPPPAPAAESPPAPAAESPPAHAAEPPPAPTARGPRSVSVREARANADWVLLAVRADDGAVALRVARRDAPAVHQYQSALARSRARGKRDLDLSSSLAAALRDGAVEGVEIARAPTPDWDRRPPGPAGDGNALPFRLAPADRAVLPPASDDDDEAPPKPNAPKQPIDMRAPFDGDGDDEAGVSRLVAALEEDGADADLVACARRACRRHDGSSNADAFECFAAAATLRASAHDGEPLDHGDGVSPAWQTPGPEPELANTAREGALQHEAFIALCARAESAETPESEDGGAAAADDAATTPEPAAEPEPDLPSEGTALWPPTLPGASGAGGEGGEDEAIRRRVARVVTKSVGGAGDVEGIEPSSDERRDARLQRTAQIMAFVARKRRAARAFEAAVQGAPQQVEESPVVAAADVDDATATQDETAVASRLRKRCSKAEFVASCLAATLPIDETLPCRRAVLREPPTAAEELALRPRGIAELAGETMRSATASPEIGTDGLVEVFVTAKSYQDWLDEARPAPLIFGRVADVRRAQVNSTQELVETALPRPRRAAALTTQPDTSATSFSTVGESWSGVAGVDEAQLSSTLRWFGTRDQVDSAAVEREKQLVDAAQEAHAAAAPV